MSSTCGRISTTHGRCIGGAQTFDVEVRFTKDASAIVTETTWRRTQQVHHHEDGSVTLCFRVDGLEEITRWLVG